MKEFRFGTRGYPLVALLSATCCVLSLYASQIPTGSVRFRYIGMVREETAQHIFLLMGVLAFVYLAALSYLRFIKRPVVRLKKKEISLRLGAFAESQLVLRPGEVLEIRELSKADGGWAVCEIHHQGGIDLLRAKKLPDQQAYVKVREHLRKFIRPVVRPVAQSKPG
jgi:hypothetical protein